MIVKLPGAPPGVEPVRFVSKEAIVNGHAIAAVYCAKGGRIMMSFDRDVVSQFDRDDVELITQKFREAMLLYVRPQG